MAGTGLRRAREGIRPKSVITVVTLLLIARLLLATTFTIAGVAKLLDRPGTVEAALGFGARKPLARAAGWMLGPVELLTAALLILTATARVGAVLGAGLLLVFALAIARSLLRGEAPDCHCFGQLHSAPVGPAALGRNAALVALALPVALAGPGTSATRWVTHLSDAGVVALAAGVAIALLSAGVAAILLSLLRRHGEVLLRLEAIETALAARGVDVQALAAPPPDGLTPGTPAPAFELVNLAGGTTSLGQLLERGQPAMLVFSDPGCGPCSALMPQLATWQQEHTDALTIVLISRGDRHANLAHAREHGVRNVLLQADREVSTAYGVRGTPSAVLVSEAGLILSPVQSGAEAISALVSGLSAPSLAIHHHRVGLPAATVTTLEGERRQLAELLDEPTALVFWNPSCGFCQQMLGDLRELEAELAPDGPRLLMISSGDAETNRAMALRSRIVLDPSFTAGAAFGASGTPSAVLVDQEGRATSGVAVGAPAVLALARNFAGAGRIPRTAES